MALKSGKGIWGVVTPRHLSNLSATCYAHHVVNPAYAPYEVTFTTKAHSGEKLENGVTVSKTISDQTRRFLTAYGDGRVFVCTQGLKHVTRLSALKSAKPSVKLNIQDFPGLIRTANAAYAVLKKHAPK